MHGFPDAAQVILQILSNPAWSGISSVCSLIGIPLAIHLSRQSKAKQPPSSAHFKKMTYTSHNLFNKGTIDQRSTISKSQEPHIFLRDGYHRATRVKELVKDVDIFLVVDTKKLAL